MKKPRTSQGSTIPFSAEDFKYRADEFLTSGHDDHGQSVRLFFRCPPALERSLEVVRDSHLFPYSTLTDIIRHAVVRHMEWLHHLESTMPRHFLGGLSAINELCRDAEMITSMQGTFTKVDGLIQSYLASGDMVEAQRLLSTTRGQLSKLPDSRWKREFTEHFSRKYSRHITSANSSLPVAPGPVSASVSGGDSDTGKVLTFPAPHQWEEPELGAGVDTDVDIDGDADPLD